MKNSLVAQILNELADYTEVEDDLPYRARAYRRAAQTVELLSDPIENIWNEKKLKELSGIGDNIERKIDEILKTGRLETLEKIRRRLPVDVPSLIRVEGIGPKTVKILYKEHDVKNLEDLEVAVKVGRLREFKGLGKSDRLLLERITSARQSSNRILLAKAVSLSSRVGDYLKQVPHIGRFAIAGSFRRRKETIGDFDVLIETNEPSAAIEFFTRQDEVKQVLAAGETKASVKLQSNFQVDVRVVPARSWGAALLYFTGSKNHNIELRTLAIKRNLKLNEYGLFKSDDTSVAGSSEDGRYKALVMDYIEPEMRENRGEIEASLNHCLPKLVGLKEIKGDLQMHTVWSDGKETIKAMANKAIHLGYEYIAITDHVGSLKIANAMDEDRVKAQRSEIEALNRNYENEGITFHVLQGAEVNIRSDGKLDMPDSVLKNLDIVLASIHGGFGDDSEKITMRITSAMENEFVDVIAHPTGRLLQERSGYSFDFHKVIERSVETETLLEIDGHPNRFDLSDENAMEALKSVEMLCLDTDSHDPSEMEYMELGVAQARRAWARKENILNTRGYEELLKYLGRN
ncbi:MAG: DNA polymerase/3'-5' exonuclease PolX [Nitrososphaerota archaeon]|nr:DNA polymerase/3'-5' exonuclease PolX [Nitrososphaerota archaeon]